MFWVRYTATKLCTVQYMYVQVCEKKMHRQSNNMMGICQDQIMEVWWSSG